jgi:hypothetical protein
MVAAFGIAASALAQTYTFTIPAGTGAKAWNTKDQMITLKKGDSLTLVNNDSELHAIHTGGRPFKHYPPIEPGKSFTEEITGTWNPDVDGPLYDHYNQDTGFFWLKVTE